MLNSIQFSLRNQYEAALETLRYVIEECPEREWNEPHGDYPFSQVVFHALFYADFYLSANPSGFRQQEYHKRKQDFFRDYEELEERLPVNLYDRHDILDYLEFCEAKAGRVISAETAETLKNFSGFDRKLFSRGELHVYNIRHIQHHAAQLGLRLQLITGKEMPWFSTRKG